MNRHTGRICSQVLRCFGCDAPIGSYRDGEEKVVMTKCSRCGTLQQRDVGWSSFNARSRTLM